MKYAVKHRTWYAYAEPAPVCHNLAHLAPRKTARQSCSEFKLHIDPLPAFACRRIDYFGNRVDYFSIETSHPKLEVTAASMVEVQPLQPLAAAGSPSWEETARLSTAMAQSSELDELQAYQFTLPSPRVERSAELRDYAKYSFPSGRSIVDALRDLTARIHGDFAFDPKATSVHTPLAEVLKLRRGVCQDFAHLAVGCVRSMGLAGRYVSGYLRTAPPPGRPRLVGADASHAWASAYCGELGWIDFDPTNDAFASDAHLTVAWGRDYGDVCPIQGVFVGGGEHAMGVSVDVAPLDEVSSRGADEEE